MVTGGAGFIGSNLVDALLARGDEVTVVDDLSTGRRENLDGGAGGGRELVELDIRDGRGAGRAGRARPRPEAIFHLAAQIDVRKSVADPAFDASINVGGTANVLEAARAGGRRGASSSSPPAARSTARARARSCRSPRTRRSRRSSPYGQSKFAAEGYLALYERLYGLSGVSLRLGNVYGPRQDPLGEAGVIAIFCGRLRAGERPTVFGDGSQTRDYIYVGDVVAAALAAAGVGGDRARSTSAPGSRPTCSSWSSGSASSAAADGFEPEFAPPRDRRGAADLDRPRARRARARLAAETGAAPRACG